MSFSKFSWERSFWPIVALLLCVLAARQVSSALLESQTFDEATHLAAGYSHWKTGDFRLNPEHPPLFRLLAALPLLVLRPDFSPPLEAWQKAEAWTVGQQFLYSNRVSADTLLFAGRAMMILVTLALGLAIAWWTRKRFGAAPALFSLFVYSFDPTIIAHGRYITNDLMVSAFLFVSCLSWLDYLESGSRRDLLQTGALAGLTFASKFNGLILYPILVLLYLFDRWTERPAAPRRQSTAWFFIAFALLPLIIVSSLYFFDMRPLLGVPEWGPRLERAGGLLRRVAHIPVPAFYYVYGLQDLWSHFASGHETYLLGKISDRGSWLYFPVAFAVKTPVATLLLLAACAVVVVLKIRRKELLPRIWLALALPPVTYFLVSMKSSIAIGVRHILPIYPFLFVLIGVVLFGENRARRGWIARGAGIVLGALLAIESFSIHPHYTAFFNRLAGGPQNGAHYLLDSNLDWGQDLKKLKLWAEENGVAPICLNYFGSAQPEYYNLFYLPLLSAKDSDELSKLDCVAAVSATTLFGENADTFRALRGLTQQQRIGYSIYIYDLRKRAPKPLWFNARLLMTVDPRGKMIAWTVRSVRGVIDARVFVQKDHESKEFLGQKMQGYEEIPWLNSGRRYVFELYAWDGIKLGPLLASVTVDEQGSVSREIFVTAKSSPPYGYLDSGP